MYVKRVHIGDHTIIITEKNITADDYKMMIVDDDGDDDDCYTQVYVICINM